MVELQKATPNESRVSIFGAGILGFGLGALVAGYVEKYALIVVLIGIALHGWGMYKIHKRNK